MLVASREVVAPRLAIPAKLLDLQAIRAERARRSLREFIQQAWQVLEPDTPYQHNWHIDAKAEHLEAVTNGQIRKLIINEPPGHMKSLSVCVFWVCWQWIDRPYWRYLCASYAGHLSTRDSEKCKFLIQSEWYQRHFGSRYSLTTQNKDELKNDKLGFRLATSIGGVGTGERVHTAINDDLIRANDALSEAMRKQAIAHLQAMSTRAVDPKTYSQVLIQQRVHEGDPTGWAREQGGWEELILPAEFVSGKRAATSIGWKDPRTEDGELLWPEKYGHPEIEEIKIGLGSYGASAQLQQDPMPGDGGLFKPDCITIIEALPVGLRMARGWDLAATEEFESSQADWTVGFKIGQDAVGRLYICDVKRFRGSPMAVENAILQTAAMDGHDVPISGPQDPGQAGKAQAAHFIRMLAGYDVEFTPETGSKVTRASPFAAQVEAGNVYMLRADWNKLFLDETRVFPFGKWDDQVDAGSRALARLTSAKRWVF